MENDILREYRCSNCNKLLFKGSIHKGKIEIKCRGCKNIDTITIDQPINEEEKEDVIEE